MEEILSESQGKILLVPKLSSHGIYNGCKHFNIFSKLFYGNGGHWGQEVIFKVAEAKFGNSSSFRRFSLENFHWFRFRGCWTSANSATLEGAQGIFSKNTFLKYLAEPFLRSLRSNDLETKNDENFLMKTYENLSEEAG